MNKKHILFPCPGIFQPSFLPQNFRLLPTSPPSYLLHLISCSLHLQSSVELPSLSRTDLQRDIDTRLEEGEEPNVERMCRGENKRSTSSQMQKRKKKAGGALHPKCRSERRKQEEHFIPNAEAGEESKRSTSSQMQKREKKARGALHPKCRSERRKQEEHFIPNAEAREAPSFLCNFFLLYGFFFLCDFFFSFV